MHRQPETHNFGATLQFGTVSAVDAAKHAVRVNIPALDNLQTDWLPVLTQAAGGNRFYCLPDPGALAVCLLDAQGESGVVLGTVYNDSDPTPADSPDLHVLQYANGTRIEHDRRTGNVLVKTAGKVTIDAPETETTGNLAVQGMLTYAKGLKAANSESNTAAEIQGEVNIKGDLVVNGIRYLTHTHGGDSGGTTTAPR
nr:MAG TPA: baseplate assembly protein V [Caudoviricetes sp.]